jgi:PTH1 family peptidyl-tRNA hydrolase
LAVDHIAGKLGFSTEKLKFKALCGECMVAGKRVLFIKPTTFMNNSGEAVRDALAFHKLPIENLIVISDDVALDVGVMRVRPRGSDGGQKGLRSIIGLTGKDDFPRVRIGVGAKPRPEMELADWVLSRFTDSDRKKLERVWENAHAAVEMIIKGDTDGAMGRYNQRQRDQRDAGPDTRESVD